MVTRLVAGSSNLTKIYVAVDKEGKVAGIGRVGMVSIGDGKEVEFRIFPGPGQKVHQVEVAGEMLEGDVTAMLKHVSGLISAKS